MHDVLLVSVVDRLSCLREQIDDGLHSKEALLLRVRLERVALDVLHGDEVAGLVLAHVKDGDDPGMLQPAGRLGLAAEAKAHLLGLARGQRVELEDGLDCDAAIDLRIVGEIDHAHGAAAYLAADLVPADGSGDLHEFRPIREIARDTKQTARGES